MKKNTFIWRGTSGYNPMAGNVTQGQEVTINDPKAQDFLSKSGLIKKPVKSQTLSRKVNERKEKTGTQTEKGAGTGIQETGGSEENVE
jgi:hypothetical protein